MYNNIAHEVSPYVQVAHLLRKAPLVGSLYYSALVCDIYILLTVPEIDTEHILSIFNYIAIGDGEYELFQQALHARQRISSKNVRLVKLNVVQI